MRTIMLALLAASAVGCESDSDTSPAPDNAQTAAQNAANATTGSTTNASNNAATNTTTQTTTTSCGETAVVTFTTTDDVTLTADFHPANTANRGAVVLFHMIPPNWDRSSYPLRVREAFQALDLNVLNVDRRGAGDSTGTARDAYEGAAGKYDAEAAVSFLLADGRACAVDGSKLMLVGASNGTTTVLDYTVGRENLELPDPAAIAWLSPGTYTANQFEIASQRTRLDPLPLLMIHPDGEPWARQFVDAAPAWKVVEIANGQHGTQNFDDGEREAIQLPELIGWASTHVAK